MEPFSTAQDAGLKEAAATRPQFPYEGVAGRTRLEAIHVPVVGGTVRAIQVYRSVNVASHPDLRAPTLAGALHRFESGEELAIPFVYHDPAALKLAVVVPESLRHEALRERSRLLDRIADDTAFAVPPYVAEATVVIGRSELADYLALPPGTNDLSLAQRTRELETLERRLVERERVVGTAEARLGDAQSQLDAHEHRLTAWSETLAQREDELIIAETREREAALSRPPTRPKGGSIPPLPSLKSEQLAVAAERKRETVPVPARGPHDDDVEEIHSIDDVITGVGPHPEAPPSPVPDEVAVMRQLRTGVVPDAPPEVVAPPELFAGGEVQMVALCAGESVWLLCRLDEGREEAFQEGIDLLVQFVAVSGAPVVILALTEPGGKRPFVRRLGIDAQLPDGRSVLDQLSRTFTAKVAFFRSNGEHLRTAQVTAEREKIVALVLEKALSSRGSDVDIATAIDRALAAPPPVRDETHPFRDAPTKANTALEARARLESINEWATPEKTDRAVLVLGISPERVEAAARSAIEDAVAFGIALPQRLMGGAVDLGLSADPAALVTRLLVAFKETSADPARSGLTPVQTAENWSQLLALATEVEVGIAPEVHEIASGAIAKGRGATMQTPIDCSPQALPKLSATDLVLALSQPLARLPAALELCRRKETSALDPLYKAIRLMTESDVVKVVPRVIALGESASDVLLDALDARQDFVRHASALALGELGLRRAVAPLIQLLVKERTDRWEDIARILGKLGTPSVRAIALAAKEKTADSGRLSRALAHLMEQGQEGPVEALQSDKSALVVAIAKAASAQRVTARAIERDLRASSDAAVSPPPWMRFARDFYGNLATEGPI